uniref:Uncharacterized protein n=1 Tax=Steinernema glaseri TaxID=37863 RepID=A0A1I7YAE1_9BILA
MTPLEMHATQLMKDVKQGVRPFPRKQKTTEEASSSGILDPTTGRIPTRPMPLPRRKVEFDFSAKFSGSFLAVRPILEKASMEQLRAFERANPILKKMCTPLW